MGRDEEVVARTVYILHLKDRERDEPLQLGYVGSTGQSLSARLYVHQSWAHADRGTSLVYRTMRELGTDAWMITPLETRVCDRRTIVALEDDYIGLIEPTLNTNRAVLDRKSELRVQRRRSNTEWYCHECCAWTTAGSRSKHLKTAHHLSVCLD